MLFVIEVSVYSSVYYYVFLCCVIIIGIRRIFGGIGNIEFLIKDMELRVVGVCGLVVRDKV